MFDKTKEIERIFFGNIIYSRSRDAFIYRSCPKTEEIRVNFV